MAQMSLKTVRLSGVKCSILFIAVIVLPASTVAQPISITDFRIPISNYQRLTGSLNGYWNKNTTDQVSTSTSTNSYSSSDATTGFNYVLGQFSEDRSLEINASVSSYLSASSNSSDYPSEPYRGDNSSHSASVMPNLSLRYSSYIQPDAWFWTVQGQGNARYEYAHGAMGQHGFGMDTSWTNFSRVRDFQYSASAGVGYGKLRDGQPIFAALRVLAKLDEDGALVRPLTREEILTLADTLARQTEYSYSQDRYYKFLMQDVFTILESMGAIKGGAASAFDVMRAFEVLLYERIEPRLFGWRVSASLMRGATQSNFQTDQSSQYYSNAKEYLQLQADYGYPVSLNTDLSANCSVLIPNKDYKRRIGATLVGRALYQVDDRIDATLSYTLTRSSISRASDDSENFERQLQHQLSAGLRFFIENNVSFNVSVGYQHAKTDIFYPQAAGYSTVYSSYTGSFGLSYRFL